MVFFVGFFAFIFAVGCPDLGGSAVVLEFSVPLKANGISDGGPFGCKVIELWRRVCSPQERPLAKQDRQTYGFAGRETRKKLRLSIERR